jgi:hypothetical protein
MKKFCLKYVQASSEPFWFLQFLETVYQKKDPACAHSEEAFLYDSAVQLKIWIRFEVKFKNLKTYYTAEDD